MDSKTIKYSFTYTSLFFLSEFLFPALQLMHFVIIPCYFIGLSEVVFRLGYHNADFFFVFLELRLGLLIILFRHGFKSVETC